MNALTKTVGRAWDPWARRVGTVALAACALASHAGCSSGSGSASDGTTSAGDEGNCGTSSSFPATALSTVLSDSGGLKVAIYAAPYQPLEAGLECLQLVVTEAASGAPVDGLTMTMTPWMPAMGHGASVTPQLTALGDGRYVFTDVSLFMPGEWQLRTKLTGASTGSSGDSVEPTFSVQ
jgi:hypothetical protein